MPKVGAGYEKIVIKVTGIQGGGVGTHRATLLGVGTGSRARVKTLDPLELFLWLGIWAGGSKISVLGGDRHEYIYQRNSMARFTETACCRGHF